MKTHTLILLAALFLPLGRGFAQDYEYPELTEAICLNTLEIWNNAINNRDEEQLAGVYSGMVKYYQTCLTNSQVRESHTRFSGNKVDNTTPLNVIFCEANVNKRLDASYWDLVEMGAKKDGPLASFLLISDLPRSSINGIKFQQIVDESSTTSP